MAAGWQGYERWERIEFCAADLHHIISDLDKLQVGDTENAISPIKHALMEQQRKLFELSRRARFDEMKKQRGE